MENQQLHIGQRFHLLAQKMSNAFVLKLRHISFHLNVSWEYSSQTLTISNSLMVRNSNQILAKLRDHKVGINLLIKVEIYLTFAMCRMSLKANVNVRWSGSQQEPVSRVRFPRYRLHLALH
ncbi:somatotropin-like isoform X1 [Oncorhynchus keta]|uniref:somatotropin-like isoform X1 n=1 Tax=Oncorhynchus keta TaxID=8018 RepID=UPI00227C04B2|nr:somatotropin-like isoform X1 [Oncorhynchus keta]